MDMIYDNKEIRIALISDIHGNLPALENVLNDIKKHDVSQIWNLGDIVGYYTYPNEVIERLENDGIESISGNFDTRVLEFAEKHALWRHRKNPDKYFAFEWNHNHLSEKSRKYLMSLAMQIRKKVGNYDVLLVHGSPLSQTEYLNTDTPTQYIDSLLQSQHCDVILCGHTHQPMTVQTACGMVINPGSVGRPEGDTRASYSLLRFSPTAIKVKHFNIEYDLQRVAAAAKEQRMPQVFIEMIKTGIGPKPLLNKTRNDGNTDQRQTTIEKFAQYYGYERRHSQHVTKLAVRIFEQLEQLAGLDDTGDKFLLQSAGILHDIGWSQGQKGHHKTGMEIISADTTLPFDDAQRAIVALVVRYHRKKLPEQSDKLYSSLNPRQQRKVDILSAILRIADGLDRSHNSAVQDVECEIKGDMVCFYCRAGSDIEQETEAAIKKSELFTKIFRKNIEIKPILIQC